MNTLQRGLLPLPANHVWPLIKSDLRPELIAYNCNEFIEKSAEVFAAEFIYPEAEMRELAASMGIDARTCTNALNT
ncbi:MAG: hypothetical protein WCD76_14160 [Pyrinomonadaceae bacterium]